MPITPCGKLQHLAGHRVLDAVDAGDAVAERDDAADLGDVDVDGVAADLVADDFGYLFGFDVHVCSWRLDVVRRAAASSSAAGVATLAS